MDKLDEERLELVRRTANFAATDAARALKRASRAMIVALVAIVWIIVGMALR